MADDDDRSERTDLAGDRTTLANDRSLAAWWRTAIAGLASAIGFVGLFGDVQPPWLVRGGGTIMVLFAMMLLVYADQRYMATANRIEAGGLSRISTRIQRIGSALLGIAALVTGVAVWLIEPR